MNRRLIIFTLTAFLLLIINFPFLASQDDPLAIFSSPAHLWGAGIESVIEEAYRQCFRTVIIGGRVMNLRLPFAMDGDRDTLLNTRINFFYGGKGNPQMLWPLIEDVLASQPFNDYINALSSGREKIVIFNMPNRTWSISADIFMISQMKAGIYRGLPHRPQVLTEGRGALESDVINYLYSINRLGMDCSGFVWHILSYIGRQGGIDLGQTLSAALRVPRGADPSRYVNTSFFNSNSSEIIAVQDQIQNLRPADIILFRDLNGAVGHAAIIQSIDFTRGIIRYLQCTNTAPVEERGVHDSYIYFDPANPDLSLSDPSLHWTQKRAAPFQGEETEFSDDGERYRHRAQGGGRVVRIRALVPVIERINQRNY